jgi:hypothetical protein
MNIQTKDQAVRSLNDSIDHIRNNVNKDDPWELYRIAANAAHTALEISMRLDVKPEEKAELVAVAHALIHDAVRAMQKVMQVNVVSSASKLTFSPSATTGLHWSH